MIFRVSAQVKDLSNVMVTKTHEQGQMMERIDDVIIDTKETAKKAEKEIAVAEKDTRKTTKKICCLTWIIIFVVTAIILIVYFSLK